MYVFAADLGGTTCKLGLFEETEDKLIKKWEVPTDKSDGGSHILYDISDAIKGCMKEMKIRSSEVLGMGFGVPGSVMAGGVVNKCVNLGWGVIPVEEEFKKISRFKNVKVLNDANAAALGEALSGSGKGYDSVVMITLGTGIGGAVVIDGNILMGSKGAAGEIGHILINENETKVCTCGKKGCLEQYASAGGFVRNAKEFLAEYEKNGDEISLLSGEKRITARDVFDAAKEGDEVAKKAVSRGCSLLGRCIAGVCNVINPSAVIIGGGVSKAGDIIIDELMDGFNTAVFHAASEVDILLASLGNDAGIYGAAKVITQSRE